MNIRKPVVAGRFYPVKKDSIIEQIEIAKEKEYSQINTKLASETIIGGVVPHAGYMYSSYQAVHFFEILKQSNQTFETVVIINPNHTGRGHEIAFDSHDSWETPMGISFLDKEFIVETGVKISDIEQKQEHSGEVMLPYLQYFMQYDFKIAPVTLSYQNYGNAYLLAEKLFQTSKKTGRKILLIASSDFSHFLTAEKGKEKDRLVLDKIKKLDSKGIEEVVHQHKISVCGYGPIMTLVEYSKMVNTSSRAKVLKIGHSGEIIPSSEVVDYISVLFSC